MFLHLNSFEDDVTEKERIKRLNFDYRHNGELWGYYGKFHRWIQQIDNEFARQKLEWMNKDIKDGFASYYSRVVYLQRRIEQPWINDICLQYYSNDDMEIFRHTTMSEIGKELKIKVIPLENYQNIYDPMDITASQDMVKEFNIYFYDMRVDVVA